MKQLFNSFICLALLSFTFVSCNNDDDYKESKLTKIVGTVENVDEVPTDMDSVCISIYDIQNQKDIIISKYLLQKNGNFNIALPAAIDDKYLYTFEESAQEGITLSDKNAKTRGISISGIKDGTVSGSLFQRNYNSETEPEIIYEAAICYSDRYFTIKGESDIMLNDGEGSIYKGIGKYDITYKKGWNIVYTKHYTEGEGENITYILEMTSNSNNAELKWYFEQ